MASTVLLSATKGKRAAHAYGENSYIAHKPHPGSIVKICNETGADIFKGVGFIIEYTMNTMSYKGYVGGIEIS